MGHLGGERRVALDVPHARVTRQHRKEHEQTGHEARENVRREVQVRGRVVDGVLRALQTMKKHVVETRGVREWEKTAMAGLTPKALTSGL